MRYFLLDIDNIKLCLDTYEYEKESFQISSKKVEKRLLVVIL